MYKLEKFEANTVGRDFVVGDIHGCFSILEARLLNIQFDEAKDRLFSVGDLVDRGPESLRCLEFLGKPWFHAIQGNHEDLAINYYKTGSVIERSFNYAYNGGDWFIKLDLETQKKISDTFEALPIAFEVETSTGLVGIVHAECVYDDWNTFKDNLFNPRVTLCALWSRDRLKAGKDTKISNIDRVYVGHSVVESVTTLGNIHYIDTGAVFRRNLTIIQIN
jgi:serine/threonine protein phosphatase 1